jgi:hypothetical protein
MGYPTNFTEPDPDDNGTQQLQAVESGPVNHRVEVLTARGFFMDDLNFDPDQPIEAADWLTFPEQKLRSITAGAVYYDGIGLNSLRARFAYYSRDVWLYLLAAGWARIGQEEAFVGRAGDLNDELGSQIIAARLVCDMMRLCFLMERVYAPYPKWFGTAFARLRCGRMLNPIFRRALLAANWKEREQHLCAAYTLLAEMHNLLEITPPLPSEASSFHGRPFRVIHGERFAGALRAAIEDEAVRRIAQGRLIGSVDQFSDSTDLLENPACG